MLSKWPFLLICDENLLVLEELKQSFAFHTVVCTDEDFTKILSSSLLQPQSAATCPRVLCWQSCLVFKSCSVLTPGKCVGWGLIEIKMSDVNINQIKHFDPQKWYRHALGQYSRKLLTLQVLLKLNLWVAVMAFQSLKYYIEVLFFASSGKSH